MNIDSFRFHMTEGHQFTDTERSEIIRFASNCQPKVFKSMIVMEECAELQQALIDGLNPNDKDAMDHILEECADVYIGLQYLCCMYDIKLRKYDSSRIRIKHPICRKDITIACRKLSVLQQAISKCVRDHDNCIINLDRRVKEVFVELTYLQKAHMISDRDFWRAVDVKLNRERIRNGMGVSA